MLIDFHTHCYKDEMAARAMSLIPKGHPGPFYDGTLSGLTSYMRDFNIKYSVCLHIANKPEHTINVNNWAIRCNQEPGVISFGSIHPFYPSFKEELKRLRDNGIRGLKFHPYYQRYEVDDKAAYPVYEACANAGMVLLFHTGLDSMAPGAFGTTDKFARVADDLGYGKVVAAHLGGSLTLGLAKDLIWGKNIYLDTSLAFRFLSDEDKKSLIKTHDVSKLLFGTDGPWADCKTDLTVFDSCDFLSDELKHMIFYKNALKLLELK